MGFHPVPAKHLPLPLAAKGHDSGQHLRGALTAFTKLLKEMPSYWTVAFFRKSMLLVFWLFCCPFQPTFLHLEALMMNFFILKALLLNFLLKAFLSYLKKKKNQTFLLIFIISQYGSHTILYVFDHID